IEVKKSDVVVGDVVRLENGDEVPADARLLQSVSLKVDESAFTGEMFATKSEQSVAGGADSTDEQTAYPRDMLLRGSTVIEGSGVCQVVAVGMDTEEGRGALLLREEPQVKTPLDSQLDSLGMWITHASYLIATLIVAGRMLYYFFLDGNTANNTDLLGIVSFALGSVMIAVTLVVVAVPEGLPMSVTISLALSMRRMLKQNNLVRRLHACETMGAATVICTDKTGTLTQNRLTVMPDSVEAYVPIDQLARAIAVNSTAELNIDGGRMQSVGNPTEGALLRWLHDECNIDYQQLRDSFVVTGQEAFSSETKRMTTTARELSGGCIYKYVKGAPEIVLDLCSEIAGGHSREQILSRLAELQSRGCRTLAFASCQLSDAGADGRLVFIGFVGMADPVRPDVAAAVETCHRAGVNVIMVTGDVALTARQIAIDTGIIRPGEQALLMTGQQFAATSDQQLIADVLPKLKVLSRARPTDKARLVGLLQQMGQVVAVTGDGTNDAPALKRAQVGLSMGDGTARAKEASDITILDNSFATINTAILWGRSLYLNIRRFILFQTTINVCACLIVLVGAFMGLDSPLNVTQMLWVNLIMDTFAAMALSSLPPDTTVMNQKPRSPHSQIIDRGMARHIVGVGLLFFVFLFGLWQLLWHYDVTSVSQLTEPDTWHVYFSGLLDFHKSKQHLSTYELGLFFSFFVMMQLWNIFNARYFRTGRSLSEDLLHCFCQPTALSQRFSTAFVSIVAAIFVGQLLIVNCFGALFGVSALSVGDWLWLLLLTSPILIVAEVARITSSR
ncbi:MAG: calcium-translocating P-type ATPase, PMCA-type, partial [Prevotella sp.]|nr:calcium-translocating P-type ATPase, PMCA-type [Prevotella sp.]